MARNQYGLTGYTHAGGLDAPVGLLRQYALDLPGPLVVLHANWRGAVLTATGAGGQRLECALTTQPAPGCLEFDWPGAAHYTNGTLRTRRFRGPGAWFGSLATGNRSTTGQIFLRNRFYDPQTGRFTQEDPIGLAGGLNAYGYANGDPVNYSDPFGLAPCPPIDTCTPSERMAILAGVGNRLEPWQPILEAGGMLAISPLMGGMGMTGGGLTSLGIAGAGTEAVAAGRMLSQTAAAKGRQTLAQQGSRILTLNRHASTGSAGTGSAAAHNLAAAGLEIGEVASAVARDIGDLSRLALGVGRGIVEVGGKMIEYTRNTMRSGETVVNFWLK